MTIILIAAAAASLAAAPAPAVSAGPASPLHQAVQADLPSLIAIYRDLHAHPELSMQEVRTPAILAAEARRLGFTVTEHVGKTGVVAVLRNGPGPTVLIRADMDGLPVPEATGLAFASKVVATARSGVQSGVTHACGHDTHMTSWIGTARRMAGSKAMWSGTLVMIGQPGEETVEGAKAMLADGLYTRFPKPDYAIAFHDSAALPAGTIGVTAGYALANVDSVDILVRGVGTHGSSPQLGRDPVLLASRIVVGLQSLVSREISPQSPGVVTVGSFHAGAKRNIISDEARLELTVRTYQPETRRTILDGIARIARGEGIAAGVPDDRMPVVTVLKGESADATFNTEALANRALTLFQARFGERATAFPPIMGSEDFGAFSAGDPKIQGLIYWVGGVPWAKWNAVKGDITKLPSLHSPQWAPDAEEVIATATESMTMLAIDLLKRG